MSSRLLCMLGVTADCTTHNRTNQYTTFSSTFYLSIVFLSHSSLFFEFEGCESRGSRGERIDLGQPIATALPDGVPPGGVGFSGLQKRPSTVLRIALSVGSPST